MFKSYTYSTRKYLKVTLISLRVAHRQDRPAAGTDDRVSIQQPQRRTKQHNNVPSYKGDLLKLTNCHRQSLKVAASAKDRADGATRGTAKHGCGRRATAARRPAEAAPTPARPPAALAVAIATTNGQTLLRIQNPLSGYSLFLCLLSAMI